MENEATAEAEWRQFRYMLFATHPAEAAALLEAVDEARDKQMEVAANGGVEEFAPELSWEELDEYQPLSAEEIEESIELLRRFGVAVTD